MMQSLQSMFEERLCKDIHNRSSLTRFMIKFAFSAWLYEHEATKGIEQVMMAIGALISRPAAIEHLALAVNNGTSAVMEAQAFENR